MDFSETAGSTWRTPTFLKKLGAVICVRAVVLLALAFAFAWPTGLRAQSAVQREYEIKVGYLYNFIRYIDWPADALPPVGGTITIGIMGENLFGPAIDTLNGKQIKGRTLAVKQITTAKDLEQCQIVFVSASEKSRLPEVFGELKDSKALTVSEIDGFASQGGIINFIYEHNKVRFEINRDAARRTGLTLSSELLKLARLVKP
jgi:hypothetical protein